MFYHRKGRRNYRQCQQMQCEETSVVLTFLKVELRAICGYTTCISVSYFFDKDELHMPV